MQVRICGIFCHFQTRLKPQLHHSNPCNLYLKTQISNLQVIKLQTLILKPYSEAAVGLQMCPFCHSQAKAQSLGLYYLSNTLLISIYFRVVILEIDILK